MDREISIIHSFLEVKISDPALHVHCVLLVLRTQVAFMRRDGSEVNIFVRLLNSRIAPDSRNSRK